MKITKYQHSCLLVEDQGKVFLIDPGMYSSDMLTPDMLHQLDYILITHEHFDHLHLPLVKELVQKFPKVKIITTNAVKDILVKEGISADTRGDDNVSVEPVPHERIWMGPQAENIEITILNKLSHPGDSHSFPKTAEILALPVSAPWGSTMRAVELAEKLQPKTIIPIHDWHWKDEVRMGFYQRLHDYFSPKGIDFKVLENGQEIEV